ncbi:carboxypeptidase regulatory-like domain-containing protein, partial [bacterium]
MPPEFKSETVTDKEGRWSLDSLPLVGWVRVAVTTDHLVNNTFTFDLDLPSAPPLYLEQGATIKGRLLTPSGEPAADVPLNPGSSSFDPFFRNNFRTGPDGRFEMKGLPAADFYVQYANSVSNTPPPFIINSLSVRGVKAGEVRDIGDLKSEKGVRITGTLLEKGTKKPVPNVWIQTFGANFQQGRSGKDGVFSLISDGTARELNINASGFGSLSKPLPRPKEGVIDLGVIELNPGMTLTGVLKSKDGSKIGRRQIVLDAENGSNHYGYTDEEGQFTIKGLEPGKYTANGGAGLKFFGNVKVTLVEGKTPPPVEFVVEAAQIETVIYPVKGRTLDSAGQPLAGVKINLTLNETTQGQSYPYSNLTSISGTDGSFRETAPRAGLTPKIINASRPGYVLVRTGDFQLVDGIWQADLTFQPRGTSLRGVVQNEAGQPAAGAYVSIMGRNDLPIVRTDATGAFSLPDVALQDVTVIASDGLGYGETKIEKAGDAPKAGDTPQVTLKKRPNEPATRAEIEALADQLLPQSRLGDQYNGYEKLFDAIGSQRLETALLSTKARSQSFDWNWNLYLQVLATRDPKSLLERSEALVAQASPNFPQIPALVVRLQARSEDPAEKAKAQAWLEAHNHPSLVVSASSVNELLRIGSVAEALKVNPAAVR